MTMFDGKSVLITGGTGSFDARLSKTHSFSKPARVIIFSRDEMKQFAAQQLVR